MGRGIWTIGLSLLLAAGLAGCGGSGSGGGSGGGGGSGSSPPPLWGRQLGGSGIDEALGVAAGQDGSVWVVGWTRGTLPDQQSQGGDDAFVAKYDPSNPGQKPIWLQQFGTKAQDTVRSVAVDKDGNVWVAGYTGESLDGPKQGDDDAFLREYAPNGNLIWKEQFGTSFVDRILALAVDKDGSVVVAGYTGGSLDGPPQVGADAFVRKYRPDHSVAWTQQFGTPAYDVAHGVAVDKDGNVWVVGETEGNLDGNLKGIRDAFLREYDKDGHLLGGLQFGSDSADEADGVATDANGNVLVVGITAGDLDGPRQGNTYDTFLRKFGPARNLLWGRQFGADGASGVAVDKDGNAIVAGYTTGDLYGKNQGPYDAILAKYDPSGKFVKGWQFGTPEDDEALAVAVDPQGNLLVAGYTVGNLDGSNAGGEDTFVRKYAP